MNDAVIQPLPVVMTTAEVAEVLRCPEETVKRYINARELEAIRIGRGRRITAQALLDFVATRRTTANRRRKSS